LGVFNYVRWRNGSGYFTAQMSNWRVFYWDIFSFSTTAPKWSNAKHLIFVNYSQFLPKLKKLKTDSQYTWKYEGNRVQYLLNSEFLEDLAQAVWAIDNLKFEHARETISELVEKVKHRNKLIKKLAQAREAGKLFVNMRVARLPVIEMTRARLKKLRIEHSENANLKERKSRLNQFSQTRLSLPHRVFQAKTSPFVNPRHGIPVFQSIKTNPARADNSAEVNKEADVLAVGRSSN
jgi:hypothetical protein